MHIITGFVKFTNFVCISPLCSSVYLFSFSLNQFVFSVWQRIGTWNSSTYYFVFRIIWERRGTQQLKFSLTFFCMHNFCRKCLWSPISHPILSIWIFFTCGLCAWWKNLKRKSYLNQNFKKLFCSPQVPTKMFKIWLVNLYPSQQGRFPYIEALEL